MGKILWHFTGAQRVGQGLARRQEQGQRWWRRLPKIIWTDKPKRGMMMMTNNLLVNIITFHHYLVFALMSLVMSLFSPSISKSSIDSLKYSLPNRGLNNTCPSDRLICQILIQTTLFCTFSADLAWEPLFCYHRLKTLIAVMKSTARVFYLAFFALFGTCHAHSKTASKSANPAPDVCAVCLSFLLHDHQI